MTAIVWIVERQRKLGEWEPVDWALSRTSARALADHHLARPDYYAEDLPPWPRFRVRKYVREEVLSASKPAKTKRAAPAKVRQGER